MLAPWYINGIFSTRVNCTLVKSNCSFSEPAGQYNSFNFAVASDSAFAELAEFAITLFVHNAKNKLVPNTVINVNFLDLP